MNYQYLTPISFHHKDTKHNYWLYQCNCGNKKVIRKDCVDRGKIKSCGCMKSVSRRTKCFGNKKEYESWLGMKRRCYKIKSPFYSYYGGRGIKVCDDWLHSFDKFIEDMGECPKDKNSLDRIDNDGNYEPSNCKWANSKEQSRNRRSNRYITYGGITKLVSDWADDNGIKRSTMSMSLNKYNHSIKYLLEKRKECVHEQLSSIC
jgi:hypothetical protein